MKAKDFNALLERRKALMTDVLMTKATEYASAADRLHNFKVAGALQGRTSSEALVGMWAKHVVSIIDLVGQAAGGIAIPREKLDEKIGDGINYLVLLEGTLRDEGVVT